MSARSHPHSRPPSAPLLVLGGALLVAGGLCALQAAEHMALLGRICGTASAHCAWCGAAGFLMAAGLASLALAVAPARGLARARA